MPELPEVEVIVRQLNRCRRLFESPISEIALYKPNRWVGITPEEIPQKMAGRILENITRRAKFIILTFDDNSRLVIHLRMTGKLICDANQENELKYTREVFQFKNGSKLFFNDSRTLGRLYYIAPNEKIPEIEKLGVEPLSGDFSENILRKLLADCNPEIKDFLLNQTKIAGIGNIYASEILFICKIHPERRTQTISPKEIQCLAQTIPWILQRSIDFNGTTIIDFRNAENKTGEFQKELKVYGRKDKPCTICGTEIKRIVQKQRSSFFCEKCQK